MTFQMKKITDLLTGKPENQLSFSYEVTPDIADIEFDSLNEQPLFYAVTWHAGQYRLENLEIPPITKVNLLRKQQKHVMVHLSCESMTKKYLLNLLNFYKEKGVRNILCILGEKYKAETSDFKSTNELITFIREVTGNYFCIGVAGFPEGDDTAMARLKEKIDIGANFIVTQAFFESSILGAFLEKCKRFDINVPVLPGIFVFETKKELKDFVNKVKGKVSDNFLELTDNKLAQNQTGTDIVSELIKELNQKWNVCHFHLFTLNKLSNINVLVKKSKI